MIQLIKRTNKKERLLVVSSVLFIIGQVWMDLKVPDYMSQITTLLQTPNTAISEILKPGGWMVLLSLMSFVFSSIVGLFVAKIAASLTCRVRQDMFGKVMDYSTHEIQQFSIPSLTTRTTNDLTQIAIADQRTDHSSLGDFENRWQELAVDDNYRRSRSDLINHVVRHPITCATKIPKSSAIDR